jgi:RNase adapter protein RapZ
METKFYFITGLSGAGKSQALKILEDFGFFCVDNLPLDLLPNFAKLCLRMGGKFRRVAIGMDIRVGEESLRNIKDVMNAIKDKGINYSILFFNANNETLLQRYSETRRKHPLGRSAHEGIRKERRLMTRILQLADKEIDTSNLTLGELKEMMARLMDITAGNKLLVSIESFGYKYGLPQDADIVMDVRFMPNPNYIPTLRQKTGKDAAVRRYINRQRIAKRFQRNFFNMLGFLLPLYVKEGKSYLTIAIGCTGGRHRSVMMAEAVRQFLKTKGYSVKIDHRDIERGSKKDNVSC